MADKENILKFLLIPNEQHQSGHSSLTGVNKKWRTRKIF